MTNLCAKSWLLSHLAHLFCRAMQLKHLELEVAWIEGEVHVLVELQLGQEGIVRSDNIPTRSHLGQRAICRVPVLGHEEGGHDGGRPRAASIAMHQDCSVLGEAVLNERVGGVEVTQQVFLREIGDLQVNVCSINKKALDIEGCANLNIYSLLSVFFLLQVVFSYVYQMLVLTITTLWPR